MNLELISDLWGCYLSRLNRQLQPCDVTAMLDLMKASENCKPANTIGGMAIPVEEEELVTPRPSRESLKVCFQIAKAFEERLELSSRLKDHDLDLMEKAMHNSKALTTIDAARIINLATFL